MRTHLSSTALAVSLAAGLLLASQPARAAYRLPDAALDAVTAGGVLEVTVDAAASAARGVALTETSVRATPSLVSGIAIAVAYGLSPATEASASASGGSIDVSGVIVIDTRNLSITIAYADAIAGPIAPVLPNLRLSGFR